jgi:archaeal type IV pilus assembly protein PilA
MMNKMFRNNRKAISPIFATLILIAIAVIAGVVVYTFTSGTLSTMTGGGTAGQEKVTVQSASVDAAGTTITVILQQTGGPAAKINGMIIKDGSGNTVGTATVLAFTAPVPTPSTLTLTTGTLTTMTGTCSALTDGTSYTVTLTTAAGGSFVSPTFTA